MPGKYGQLRWAINTCDMNTAYTKAQCTPGM